MKQQAFSKAIRQKVTTVFQIVDQFKLSILWLIIGISLNDAFMNCVLSITKKPTPYCTCFMSYSSRDQEIINRLYADLQSRGVHCWYAPHELKCGDYFRERIDQAIHTQDKVLLILSSHSIKSGWVRYEVELALSRENREMREILFPIRLDDAIFASTESWAMFLQATRHIGDFTNWQNEATYQQAFTTLLQHLKVDRAPTP